MFYYYMHSVSFRSIPLPRDYSFWSTHFFREFKVEVCFRSITSAHATSTIFTTRGRPFQRSSTSSVWTQSWRTLNLSLNGRSKDTRICAAWGVHVSIDFCLDIDFLDIEWIKLMIYITTVYYQKFGIAVSKKTWLCREKRVHESCIIIRKARIQKWKRPSI